MKCPTCKKEHTGEFKTCDKCRVWMEKYRIDKKEEIKEYIVLMEVEKINKNDFLNQKAKDMTIGELLSALKQKVNRFEKEHIINKRIKGEPKVGDTVRIIEDWVDGFHNKGREGQIGKVTELTTETDKRRGYPYKVMYEGDGKGYLCHKVELVAKATEKKERKQKLIFGIDIVTDTTIPKGTVAFGYHDRDKVIITNIEQFPEKKKSLSDKIFDNPDDDDMLLLGDVIEAVKEFMDWFGKHTRITMTWEEFETKAKEIFGDRIIGVKK